MALPFRYTIGLEVHVELSTVTKMFCRCKNEPFGGEPNQYTCPICLGLPGTLPVPNKEAIRKTIIVGKALGSTIAEFSKFDRKHYFYPDLPKGYQISQYDLPFCVGGLITIPDPEFTVTFERVHLEEDAGKLMHTGKSGYSKVDLNRAGVPLIEMVTEPVIQNPVHARAFMQELRLLMRTLGVSEADMEKGHMRCDANVSIQFEWEGKEVSSPITEIKNVNSTRSVERALTVEAQRMYDEWMADGPIRQRKNKITVGWDDETNTVHINRAKEAAKDYRYFPEPDIPPFMVHADAELNPDNITLPELPAQTRSRYAEAGITAFDTSTLLASPELLASAEAAKTRGVVKLKQVVNWLINVPGAAELQPDHFDQLLQMAEQGDILFSAVKAKFSELQKALAQSSSLKEVAESLGLLQQHDASMVQSAIESVLTANPQAIQDFKDGKEKILGFLVGQVMKQTAGKSNPGKIQEALREELAKR